MIFRQLYWCDEDENTTLTLDCVIDFCCAIVACQCVKLQLAHLGLEAEFLPCQIQVKESAWDGVRRKYWHGRDTYYLPKVTWNPQAVNGTIVAEQQEGKNKLSPTKQDQDVMAMEVDNKRPRN